MTTLDEQLKAMGEACIDNTPQQVESLSEQVEWDNGVPPIGAKCEFEYPKGSWRKGYYHGLTGTKGLKMHILEYEGGAIETLGSLVKFRKPESPQEKAKRERDEQAKLLLIDLCGDDVFKDRDWEYHKKFTHSAELAFRLVDKKWRKGE